MILTQVNGNRISLDSDDIRIVELEDFGEQGRKLTYHSRRSGKVRTIMVRESFDALQLTEPNNDGLVKLREC